MFSFIVVFIMVIVAISSLLMYFSGMNKKNEEITKLTEEIKKNYEEKIQVEKTYQEKILDLKRDLEMQKKQNAEEVRMFLGKISILDDKFNTFAENFTNGIFGKFSKKLDTILENVNTLPTRNHGTNIDDALMQVEKTIKDQHPTVPKQVTVSQSPKTVTTSTQQPIIQKPSVPTQPPKVEPPKAPIIQKANTENKTQ